MVIRTGALPGAPDLAAKVGHLTPREGLDTSRTNSADLDLDVATSPDSCSASLIGSESDGISFSRQSTEALEGGWSRQATDSWETTGLNRQVGQLLEDARATGTDSSPRSPNRARMRNKFYKIKMCHFVATGTCKKPNSCSFAHSPEELLPMPDLRNTKTCPNILIDGRCEDKECRFAHAKDELRIYRQARKQRILAMRSLKHDDPVHENIEEAEEAPREAQQEPPLGASCCVRNTFLSWGPATLTESLQLQGDLRRGSSLPDLGTAERHIPNAEQRANARMRLDSDHVLLRRLGEGVRNLRSQFPAK